MPKLTIVLLGPDKHSKSATEAAKPYMDYDYFHKLSPDEQKFLNDFNRSYYMGRLPRDKKLAKTKRIKLDIYSSSHAKRRSVEVGHCAPIPTSHSIPSPEDALIEAIDLSRKKK